MSVSELLEKLGEPTRKERATLNFPTKNLRVTPDFSTRTRVSDVTGETDLAFGDKILARIGQTPEEIHAVLGSPDEALESTLSDLETRARVETYSRFQLTVYYRYSPQHRNFGVVMFSLTNSEMDDYLNEDPTER